MNVSENSQSPFYTRRWVVLGAVVLCATLPYLNALFGGFVYDDTSQLQPNPYIQNFRYLRQIFTSGVWSFASAGSKYYRPMMSFGYLLCYKAFGWSTFGFHAVNVILNLLIVVALFFLTAEIFRDRRMAFWSAVIFALHPIHTESVAWISGVTDLELSIFYLITFCLFLRSARPKGTTSRPVQIAMLATFALATLSKEPALTLPILATIYEHFFRQDRRETTWKQKISRYDLLWAGSGVYLLVRIRMLGKFAPTLLWPDLSHKQLVLSAVALFGQYVGKLVYPAHLCVFYVFHKSVRLLDWRVLAGGLAMLGIAAVFAVLWRRAHDLAFGVLWFVVILLPVLNPQWVGENTFAERYLYLPSVGFCWIVAWGGLQLWNRLANRPAAYRHACVSSVALVLVLGSIKIITRNRDWHDDLTLYTQTLTLSPDAYIIRNNLGDVYEGIGDPEEAERQWQEVLRLHPNYTVTLGNLGILYSKRGLYTMAANYLERAVKAYPGLVDNHIKLAVVYASMHQWDKAEAESQKAIALAPYNMRAYLSEAYLFSEKGDDVQAERILHQAESISPRDSQLHSEVANFYASRRRTREARSEYKTALQLDPANGNAVKGLRELDQTTHE